MTHPTRRGMSAEQVRPGMRVRVMEHHMDEQRRDPLLVGKVVARYGAEDYMAVDVRLDGGRYGLFWPSDLEEIYSPKASWWRSLLGRGSAG
jgi:hypothetical protein